MLLIVYAKLLLEWGQSMYIFIINPMSGKGDANSSWMSVKRMLDHKNIHYEAYLCKSFQATQLYIKEKCESTTVKAFVVIGGDGTISSVIQQLAFSNIPLAVLPAGSGNDVCRNFNLISDPILFVEKLLQNKSIHIDLICVNNMFGMTVAGIGLDAMIGKRADQSIYKKWLNRFNRGSFAYTIAAIIELLTFQPFQGDIRIDGKTLPTTDLWLIANGNVKKYGGGLLICPDADPMDGWINLTVLHDANRFKVLTKLFPALLHGKPLLYKEIIYRKGTHITIHTNKLLPVVVDGEIRYADNFEISIQTKALRLMLTN